MFEVGDKVRLVAVTGKGIASGEFENLTGVIQSIDPPGTSWPIEVLFPGETETFPFDPEELEHVSEG